MERGGDMPDQKREGSLGVCARHGDSIPCAKCGADWSRPETERAFRYVNDHHTTELVKVAYSAARRCEPRSVPSYLLQRAEEAVQEGMKDAWTGLKTYRPVAP